MREVDLFVEHPILFEELWRGSELVSSATESVRIASIPHLIALKQLANRAEDLIEIKALRAILAAKELRRAPPPRSTQTATARSPSWRSAAMRRARRRPRPWCLASPAPGPQASRPPTRALTVTGRSVQLTPCLTKLGPGLCRSAPGLDLSSRNLGVPLEESVYTNAVRYPFDGPGAAGLSIPGSGRGCNRLTGKFQVLDRAIDGTGALTSFTATFEQHCEGGAAALRGCLHVER